MASKEDVHQPLLDPFTSRELSHMRYNKSSSDVAALNMTSFPAPITKDKNKCKRSNMKRLRFKKLSAENVFTVNLSKRLSTRKLLHNRL